MKNVINNLFLKGLVSMMLVAVFVVACKEKVNSTQAETFELSVSAQNFPDSTKVYLYNRNIGVNIDSTFVINESFKFFGKVELPSLCYLNFYDKNNEPLDAYNYFYLENKKISITGNYSNFINARVVGSKQTDLDNAYSAIALNSKKTNKRFNQLQFLYSNANNQMALTELLFQKKKISKDSLLLFYKKLDTINSRSIKGRELLAYASSIDLQVGDNYRKIFGKDLNGTPHKLSDYEGKIILLDFWASGCPPCRLQNKTEFPNLIKKYSNNNFMIVSYSLDTREKDWRAASNEDKITWLNISDLKGLKSEHAKAYVVTTIPNSFLIDQNGIVVKSFVGFSKGTNTIEKEIDKHIK